MGKIMNPQSCVVHGRQSNPKGYIVYGFKDIAHAIGGLMSLKVTRSLGIGGTKTDDQGLSDINNPVVGATHMYVPDIALCFGDIACKLVENTLYLLEFLTCQDAFAR